MKTTLQAGGLLSLPARLLKKFRLAPGADFEVLALNRRLFWLLHEPENTGFSADPKSLTMTGNVSAIGVADLFSILNMGQHTGALVFMRDDSEKTVFFENGEIIFATSNDRAERIGSMMLQLGKITRGQLNEAEKTMRPGVRFGSHLIQQGLLTPDELFSVVRTQVEEILYSLFTMKDGVFMFYHEVHAPEDLVQFKLNTQNIMMEGFRRLDEWQILREKIPGDHIVPQLLEDKNPPESLPPAPRQILGLVDGKRTVAELMKASGKGPFVVYRMLYDLQKLGLLTLPNQAAVRNKKKGSGATIGEFNRLFRTITRELSQFSGFNLESSYRAFVTNLPQNARTILDGIPINAQGQLDEILLLKRVQEAVSRQGAVSKIAGVRDLLTEQTLVNVLNESLNFFLFTARNTLPEKKASRLIAAIRNVQKNLLDKK